MRILITGSNSGFGKLASLTLARQGHHIIATMRSVDKGEALLAEAAAEGLDIEIRQLDVCAPDSIAGALADAAGIAQQPTPRRRFASWSEAMRA